MWRQWLERWGILPPGGGTDTSGRTAGVGQGLWPRSPDTKAHHRQLRGAVQAARHWVFASDMPVEQCRFVVFDTETTGFQPHWGDRIISLSGVVVSGGAVREHEVFDERVNPGRPVPPQITQLTGIATEDIVEAAGLSEVLYRFLTFAGPAVLVGHNVDFDLAFLNRHVLRHCGFALPHPVVDTRRLCQRLHPDHNSECSLDALVSRYAVPALQRHRALDDARMTAQVFVAELARLRHDRPLLVGDIRNPWGTNVLP